MRRSHLESIARHLADSLRSRNDALCLQMTRLLIEGRPVPPARLAATLGRSTEQVTEVLAHLTDVERDEDGNVVGWGLTLIPTPHQFQVDGHLLYTWCAFDALSYPPLFKQEAKITSICPVTDVPVLLSIAHTGIVNLIPESAVISLKIPVPFEGDDGGRATFCHQGHFFASPDAAARWQTTHPGTQIFSVEDAYQLGQLVAFYRYANGKE
jgi:alkylmercury lyase